MGNLIDILSLLFFTVILGLCCGTVEIRGDFEMTPELVEIYGQDCGPISVRKFDAGQPVALYG